MFVVTVASIAFSDSIYGEDSIFNSSPTGVGGIDKAYQMIPAFIDCVKVVFIIYVIGKVCQFILTKALSGSNKGITASKLICSLYLPKALMPRLDTFFLPATMSVPFLITW